MFYDAVGKGEKSVGRGGGRLRPLRNLFAGLPAFNLEEGTVRLAGGPGSDGGVTGSERMLVTKRKRDAYRHRALRFSERYYTR